MCTIVLNAATYLELTTELGKVFLAETTVVEVIFIRFRRT